MSENILWTGYYRLSYPAKPNSHDFGYCLAFATGRDDFQQKIDAYSQIHQCDLVSQLAPLPAGLWFERHGFNALIWQHAQAIQDGNLYFLSQEEKQSTLSQDNYLEQQTVIITPLPDVFHQSQPVLATPFLPPELRERGFFTHLTPQANPTDGLMSADTDFVHLPNTPRYYAVIDGVKSLMLPSLCEREGRTESLYKGELKRRMDENAPFLTQLTVSEHNTAEFVHLLFAQSEKEWFGLWDLNPAIFIRSRQPFDKIHYHFRKFTHLYNEQTEKWYFFRFYEPAVLVSYLQYIAKEPTRLASFFGYREGESLIDAIAARVGNAFHIFSLKDLPPETQPSAVSFDEFLRGFVADFSRKNFAQTLILDILPHEFSELTIEEETVIAWLAEGQKMGLLKFAELELVVKANLYLQNTDITIAQLNKKILSDYGEITEPEQAKLLYLKAKALGESHEH